MFRDHLVTTNIILYCREWEKTVRFYKSILNLPVTFSFDWFVEFQLTDNSRLSIADERRSSKKSDRGKSITLALEVADIHKVWNELKKKGLNPTDLKFHPWNALVFYIFDPDGHRIEIWETAKAPINDKQEGYSL